jgi:protein gp37
MSTSRLSALVDTSNGLKNTVFAPIIRGKAMNAIMNRTKIEWVKNPDGSKGYTWNPITGCLNGCEYCYARKLANRRLKNLYLANERIAPIGTMIVGAAMGEKALKDPFHPRFWPDRLFNDFRKWAHWWHKAKGIFVCNMSDLFGRGIPDEWTRRIMKLIERHQHHRFYLLTKQPQNLLYHTPFPDNCWVGVTVTDCDMLEVAASHLLQVKARVKYISAEPLLAPLSKFQWLYATVDWIIIGAQTNPYNPPKIEWVQEIVNAADKAGKPVFLKDNLKPLFPDVEITKFGDKERQYHSILRQEFPRC